jgi:hypothetical protein
LQAYALLPLWEFAAQIGGAAAQKSFETADLKPIAQVRHRLQFACQFRTPRIGNLAAWLRLFRWIVLPSISNTEIDTEAWDDERSGANLRNADVRLRRVASALSSRSRRRVASR